MSRRRYVKVICTNQNTPQVEHPDISKKKEKLKECNAIFSYENTIKKLDSFAKWLFASTSIVGALAAGFSITNYSKLDATGETLFRNCIIAITISLVLATLALKPIGSKYCPNNLTKLKKYIEFNLIRMRRLMLRIAAWTFALAIIFAGLTPILSNVEKENVLPSFSVDYEFIPEYLSKIEIKGQYIPSKNSSVRINKFQNNSQITYYNSSLNPDLNGSIQKDIIIEKGSNIFPFDSLIVECRWVENDTTNTFQYLIKSI